MIDQSPTPIHEAVREHYAAAAKRGNSCCDCDQPENSLYPVDLLAELPADISTFSLGCGDPTSLAELKPGETVLDLGSGGGLDCFLAARMVGPEGDVIGVDMTPEMIERAKANAARMGIDNVEFRYGYLEALPVDDNSVDVVISNCVINLSPDKQAVFAEMFRAVKPGGRVSVSDIVTNGELPEEIKNSMAAWGACVAGALEMDEYVEGLQAAGFTGIRVTPKTGSGELLDEIPQSSVFSASITACKPTEEGKCKALEPDLDRIKL